MKNKENLREKQVNLRLTQAEYERLTRTAQDHGIGRAAYLRMVLRLSLIHISEPTRP